MNPKSFSELILTMRQKIMRLKSFLCFPSNISDKTDIFCTENVIFFAEMAVAVQLAIHWQSIDRILTFYSTLNTLSMMLFLYEYSYQFYIISVKRHVKIETQFSRQKWCESLWGHCHFFQSHLGSVPNTFAYLAFR